MQAVPIGAIGLFEQRAFDERLIEQERLTSKGVERGGANPAVAVSADHARVQALDDDTDQVLGRHDKSLPQGRGAKSTPRDCSGWTPSTSAWMRSAARRRPARSLPLVPDQARKD